MKCLVLGIYYTLRYGLKRGELIDGHHLLYTGKVWFDYWMMECQTCGKEVASEIGPQAEMKYL